MHAMFHGLHKHMDHAKLCASATIVMQLYCVSGASHRTFHLGDARVYVHMCEAYTGRPASWSHSEWRVVGCNAGNRPSSSLMLPDLSAYTTGQVLALYENITAAMVSVFLQGWNPANNAGYK